jgi:hypothetical protein
MFKKVNERKARRAEEVRSAEGRAGATGVATTSRRAS